MSTHATISIKREDGSVATYYCHYDGYFSHMGRVLVENFGKENISKLDTNKAIKFITRDGTVEFFDDGNGGVDIFLDESAMLKSDAIVDQEYAYYWNGRAWYLIMEGCLIPMKGIKFGRK